MGFEAGSPGVAVLKPRFQARWFVVFLFEPSNFVIHPTRALVCRGGLLNE
jgi:hypothetical protein